MRSAITKAIFAAGALAGLAQGRAMTPWKRQIDPPLPESRCFDEIDGGKGTVWGDKLQLLRGVWDDAFAGDFGGSLKLFEIKGVWCQQQCLWIRNDGDTRDWSGDEFGPAFDKLAGLVGEGEEGNGYCQQLLRPDEDYYLFMHTAQWDAYTGIQGRTIWDVVGDTCTGTPGYVGTF